MDFVYHSNVFWRIFIGVIFSENIDICDWFWLIDYDSIWITNLSISCSWLNLDIFNLLTAGILQRVYVVVVLLVSFLHICCWTSGAQTRMWKHDEQWFSAKPWHAFASESFHTDNYDGDVCHFERTTMLHLQFWPLIIFQQGMNKDTFINPETATGYQAATRQWDMCKWVERHLLLLYLFYVIAWILILFIPFT